MRVVLYDDNDITIDGPTSMSFSEDVLKRYEVKSLTQIKSSTISISNACAPTLFFQAYGWHTLRVEDGDNDLSAIDAAISAAKAETERPTIISVRVRLYTIFF
jgi:transketolase